MNQRRISIPDLIVAAAGLLAIIATLLPWWAMSDSIAGQKASESVTVNAWNAASHGELGKTITGPLAWIPMLALLLLGALALARAFAAPQLLAGKVFYQVTTGVGGLAVAFVALRWVTYFKPPSSVTFGSVTATVSTGASFGTYLGLLLALAVTAAGIWALSQPHLIGGDSSTGGGYPAQVGGYPQHGHGQQPPIGHPQQVGQTHGLVPDAGQQPLQGYQQPPTWQ